MGSSRRQNVQVTIRTGCGGVIIGRRYREKDRLFCCKKISTYFRDFHMKIVGRGRIPSEGKLGKQEKHFSQFELYHKVDQNLRQKLLSWMMFVSPQRLRVFRF